MLGRIIRWLGVETALSLLLLLVVSATVSVGLAQVIRDVGALSLFLTAVYALVVGWLLASSPLPGWLGAVVAIILSVEITLLQVGRLGSLVLALLRALFSLGAAVWRWPLTGSLDGVPTLVVLRRLAVDSGQLLDRAWRWTVALVGGQPSYDPLAAALAWHLVLWMIVAWAVWAVRRLRRPLMAVAPAGALLASTLSYSRVHPEALLALLAASLPLLALVRYHQRQAHWRRNEIDYPVDTGQDVGFAVAGLTIGLLFVAVLFPTFSIQQAASRARDLLRGPAEQTERIASSLGLAQGSAPGAGLHSYREPGLPCSHLIGSGPELSEQVAMLVNVSSDQPRRLYWRSHTYDVYTGIGWSTTESQLLKYKAREPATPAPTSPHLLVRAEYRVMRDGGGLLYSVGTLHTADRNFQVGWRAPPPSKAGEEGDFFGATVGDNSYHADSWVPTPSKEQLRGAGEEYPEWLRDRYLALPDSVPERVGALAGDLTAGAPTPFDRARAIESHLRTFTYTLDLPSPPTGGDVADYFLFELQQGYCDYYATSMVVLARAAGLPARLVVGYAGGTYDEASSLTTVTAAQAHSWVEVYFPGVGWVEFEPTGGRPVIERPEEALLPVVPDVVGRAWASARDLIGATRLWWGAMALLAPAGLIWWVVARRRLRRRPPAEVSATLYRRLSQHGRRIGVPSQAGDTPYEFAAKLGERLARLAGERRAAAALGPAAEELGWLTRLYVAMQYGPRPPDRAARAQAIQTWRHLRWRLWLAWLWSWT